jgi:L-cysteine desulfidase
MVLTAAATDARMSGCNLPVIANTGSGIKAFSYIAIHCCSPKAETSSGKHASGIAMGILVSIHIKNKVGLLSCLCGACPLPLVLPVGS